MGCCGNFGACSGKGGSAHESAQEVLEQVATKLGECHLNALRLFRNAEKKEEEERVTDAVALYKSAFRMWPELDSKAEDNGVPCMVKLQYEEIFGRELRISKGICTAPYVTGDVVEMVRRTRHIAVSEFELYMRRALGM